MTLTLSTMGQHPPCDPATVQVVVTINALPAITAQPTNATVFVGSPAIFTVAATGVGQNYQWQVSTNGGTTFTNISDTATNASYTNATTTLADNGKQYQVIVGGVCPPQTSTQAVLTVHVVEAWVGFSHAILEPVICSNSQVNLSGALAPGTTGFEWVGAGTFYPSTTTLDVVYTPTAAENSAGSATVTLMATNPAWPTYQASASVTVTVVRPATVSAGANQTVCADSPQTQLAGLVEGTENSEQLGGDLWWWYGAGDFLPDPSATNAVYTPTAAEIAAGQAMLTLAAYGPWPCWEVTSTMTITINPVATASAGPNQTICAGNVTAGLGGTVGGGATGGTWSSSGTGSFAPAATTLNAIYTPSASDVAAGAVTLTMTSAGQQSPCTPAAAQVVVTINQAATASTGANQTTCAGSSTAGLGGTAGGGATGGTWSSSGTGGFAPNATALNATYSPSAADITAGTVALTLTSTGQLVPCGAATAQVVVTINALPAITSKPTNLTVCAGMPAIFSVAAMGTGLTYQWQVSQDGGVTFTNISDTATNANYTNIAPALFDDFNLYQVIVSGACSPVVTSTPPTQLSVNLRPTANAGMVLPVCASSPAAQLQGLVAPVGTIGTWSGAGTFAPNATTLNAIYTPTAAEIALGTATVTLTATSQQGQCAPESSTTTITINRSATVSAGPNQSVCASGPATQLEGSFGGPVTLAWWTGAGRFAPSRYVLNPVYTPTAAEIAAGTATVTLTTDAPSWPCEAVSASMTITIIPMAAASAGGDQTICSDSSTAGLGGSVGASATGGLWTSSGTGTFTPNVTALNATYHPSAADIAAGTVTLTLTAQPCSASAAQVVVTIKPAATASAGGNQAICAGASTAALGGTVGGGATGGLWTSSGTGTFAPDTTTLNATYAQSAGDIEAGTVTLTLSSTGQQSPCGPATAQVIVTVHLAALGTSSLPEGPGAGSDSVVLSVNPATATWTAAANAAWLHLSEANQSGTGSTNVVFSCDANPGATRTGTLTIACQTLTVTQAGSTYVAAPGPATALVASGLSAPYGVAVDGAGNVFVCDSGHNAIKEWTVANNTVTTLVSSGLNGPNGVAVDGAGNVYIADTRNNAIKEWMPANNTVTTLVAAGLNQPWGIAVDGAGNVYIADYGNNAIKQWTAANSNVTTLASGLSQPRAVAVDGAGNVYIAQASQIKKWTAANNKVTTLVSSGLGLPNAVAVDGGGNVYISDTAAHAIRKWTAASNTVATVVSPGLNIPEGVAVDGAGNVYFTDHNSNAIKELPRAFLDPTANWENVAAGSDVLPVVVPATANLLAPFAPTSDQGWLTITGITNGVVSFAFSANTGSTNRTAHITLLGQPIAITQVAPPIISGQPASITVCEESPAVFTAAAAGSNLVYQWQVSQDGGTTFTNISATATNASYTNMASTLADNGNQYQVVVSGGGASVTSAPPAVLTVNTSLTAGAGANQTICAGGATAGLGGTVGGSATGGTWSSSGTGTFVPDANTLNPTYVPSSADLAAGTVTLTLSTMGQLSPCGAAMAQATITLAATAGASANQTICVGSATAGLGGTVGGSATGGLWTASGTGGFAPSATALNATYNPSAADIVAGGVTLTLTTTGQGASCPSATAQVVVTINAPPAITFSPASLIVAAGSSATFSVGATGPDLTYQWQFNGTNPLSIDGIITTVAGNGGSGFSGDGGAATDTSLSYPAGVSVDGAGNLFIADTSNERIRKVDTNGLITTVAGIGSWGGSGDGGTATNARLANPLGVAVDGAGNLFIADYNNLRVRKVDTSGIITTVAGGGSGEGAGDGGAATNAMLAGPVGVAVDAAGNLFIADYSDQRIRKVDTNGIITTVAGNGSAWFSGDGGAATNACLNNPNGVAVDGAGNLFIADDYNQCIRKVDTKGIITTVAGTGSEGFSGDGGEATNAGFNFPLGVAVDGAGRLFIADAENDRIRKVVGFLTCLPSLSLRNISPADAGSYSAIVANACGSVTSAVATLTVTCPAITLTPPTLPAAAVGVAYSQSLGASGSAGACSFTLTAGSLPAGMIVSGGGVLCGTPSVTGTNNFTVTAIDTNGCTGSQAYTLAILGVVPAISVQPVSQTNGVGSRVIFEVTATGSQPLSYQWQFNGTNLPSSGGIIRTVAGNGSQGFSGDGGAAIIAGFFYPWDVRVDGAGNLFITDTGNARIRKVDINGIVTTVAGNGAYGFSGDGGLATNASLYWPEGLAVDGAGNLFIADNYSTRIRKVDINGIITTVAGIGVWGFSGDGGAATNAMVNGPSGVAVDGAGNLFIADYYNQRIRKVDASGIITTVAGNGSSGFSGDGGADTDASLDGPYGVAVDGAGDLFIADAGDSRIRKVDASGIITTVAGNGSSGFSGDGGAATNASLNGPYGVAVDGAGNLFIADTSDYLIRKVDTSGIIRTVAGNGRSGFSGDGGAALNAKLNAPYGVAVDGAGNLFIADPGIERVRKVVEFSPLLPTLILQNISAADAGSYSVIVGNAFGSVTSAVATLTVTCPAITLTPSTLPDAVVGVAYTQSLSASGDAAPYRFTNTVGSLPAGLSLSGGGVLSGVPAARGTNTFTVTATDSRGCSGSQTYALAILGVIPAITAEPGSQTNTVGLTATFSVAATGSQPFSYQWQFNGTNLADNGRISGSQSSTLTISNLLFADAGSYAVAVANAFGSANSQPARLTVVPGYAFTNFAGLPTIPGSADGSGSAAQFNSPFGAAVDSAGNVFVADYGNNTIRKVTAAGLVTTLAGSAEDAGSADGTGSAAQFNSPFGVAVDSAGDVFVADYGNNTIRKVTAAGVVTTLAGSAGNFGSADGTGSAAQFNGPAGVAVDSAGNVFVADNGNNTIRKVTAAGVVTTLAGSAAQFNGPAGAAVDSAGNVFVADNGNNTIRKVTAAGVVTTLAGSAGNFGSADGTGSAAQFNSPFSVAVDDAGNVFVADYGNNTIRKVTSAGVVTTVGGTAGVTGAADGVGVAAQFNAPAGVAVDSAGNLYVADSSNNRITKGTPVYGGFATPVLTWTNPASITYGTALNFNQLNATASVLGAFNYTPSAGTVLTVGTNLLSVAFTPADTTDYATVTGTVSLVVLPAPLTVTASNATRPYGLNNPVFTGTITGLTNGDNLTPTYSCNATPASPPGPYLITPILSDPNNRLGNYTVTTNNGTLTVTCAAIALSPTTLPAVIAGAGYTQALTAVGGAGPYSFTNSVASLPAGLSLSGDGLLSGTLSTIGTDTFTVMATDTNGCTGSQAYTLTVSGGLLMPGIVGISLSGTNLVFSGNNGLSGRTYHLLMCTNLALPLNQWVPVATNQLSASGSFTLTATNAVSPAAPQRFYMLQVQ